MALRSENFRLSGLRSWMASLLRAAASLIDESDPAKANCTGDIDNSGANDPLEATIARLREQYPRAPEHWIRVLAEQTSVGNSRAKTARASSPAERRQGRDEQERKSAVFPQTEAAGKAAAPPALFSLREEPTRRVRSGTFLAEPARKPAGGAAHVAFPQTVQRPYPPLSIPAVRIRWMKEPSRERQTPAPAQGKNRRSVGLQFHASPAPERAPQSHAEPAAFTNSNRPRRGPEADFKHIAEQWPLRREGLPIENYQQAAHQADYRQTFHRGGEAALNEQPMRRAPPSFRGDISENADRMTRFRRIPERDFTARPRFEPAFFQAPDSAASPADFTQLRSAESADGAALSCDFRAEAPKWPDLPAPPHEGSSGAAPRLGNHFWRQEAAGLWNELLF